MNKIILRIILAVIILVVVFFFNKDEDKITNFWECVDAGNEIMESYPRRCRDDNNNFFIENIGNELEKMDLIFINTPRPNSVIESPLTIKGQAIGTWYFEGDFPVILTDGDGKIIAEGFVSTEENWMTEDFVSFEGVLEFEKPSYDKRGTLILRKDNPSDLPELDDALELPIFFE
jgi:hypothetical protein